MLTFSIKNNISPYITSLIISILLSSSLHIYSLAPSSSLLSHSFPSSYMANISNTDNFEDDRNINISPEVSSYTAHLLAHFMTSIHNNSYEKNQEDLMHTHPQLASSIDMAENVFISASLIYAIFSSPLVIFPYTALQLLKVYLERHSHKNLLFLYKILFEIPPQIIPRVIHYFMSALKTLFPFLKHTAYQTLEIVVFKTLLFISTLFFNPFYLLQTVVIPQFSSSSSIPTDLMRPPLPETHSTVLDVSFITQAIKNTWTTLTYTNNLYSNYEQRGLSFHNHTYFSALIKRDEELNNYGLGSLLYLIHTSIFIYGVCQIYIYHGLTSPYSLLLLLPLLRLFESVLPFPESRSALRLYDHPLEETVIYMSHITLGHLLKTFFPQMTPQLRLHIRALARDTTHIFLLTKDPIFSPFLKSSSSIEKSIDLYHPSPQLYPPHCPLNIHTKRGLIPQPFSTFKDSPHMIPSSLKVAPKHPEINYVLQNNLMPPPPAPQYSLLEAITTIENSIDAIPLYLGSNYFIPDFLNNLPPTLNQAKQGHRISCLKIILFFSKDIYLSAPYLAILRNAPEFLSIIFSYKDMSDFLADLLSIAYEHGNLSYPSSNPLPSAYNDFDLFLNQESYSQIGFFNLFDSFQPPVSCQNFSDLAHLYYLIAYKSVTLTPLQKRSFILFLEKEAPSLLEQEHLLDHLKDPQLYLKYAYNFNLENYLEFFKNDPSTYNQLLKDLVYTPREPPYTFSLRFCDQHLDVLGFSDIVPAIHYFTKHQNRLNDISSNYNFWVKKNFSLQTLIQIPLILNNYRVVVHIASRISYRKFLFLTQDNAVLPLHDNRSAYIFHYWKNKKTSPLTPRDMRYLSQLYSKKLLFLKSILKTLPLSLQKGWLLTYNNESPHSHFILGELLLHLFSPPKDTPFQRAMMNCLQTHNYQLKNDGYTDAPPFQNLTHLEISGRSIFGFSHERQRWIVYKFLKKGERLVHMIQDDLKQHCLKHNEHLRPHAPLPQGTYFTYSLSKLLIDHLFPDQKEL